jgi:lipoprotein-releasing system ATP-binding protein
VGGQSVALVAPSGAGKSTLLHIAGLLESPRRRARSMSAGAPTSQLSDIGANQIRRTDIGFVYQSHRLLPEFSALENVMLPQMIRGLKRSRPSSAPPKSWPISASATASSTGRRTVRRRAAAGGDRARGRQRAAGAVADEPTGNLDPHTADHVFGALMQLVRRPGSRC